MATRRLKRPRDPAQLAKLIVDIATGEVEDQVDDTRNKAAVARGRLGGQKGALFAYRFVPSRKYAPTGITKIPMVPINRLAAVPNSSCNNALRLIAGPK